MPKSGGWPGLSRLLLTLPLLALIGPAQGSTIIDQSNLGSGLQLTSLNDVIAEWQQQVTDGIGGLLAGIELYSVPGTTSDHCHRVDWTGSRPYLGAFAFTTTVTFGPCGGFIDTSSADITLTPGEVFVIDVSNASADLTGVSQPYAGGDLWVPQPDPHDFTANGGTSMEFETFVATSSSSPETGTVVLIAGGLLYLIRIARRRAAA